jgi:hypothetical protein
VTDSYEDSTFNGRDWVCAAVAAFGSKQANIGQIWILHTSLSSLQEKDLADGLIATSAAESPEKAYQQIERMLANLDDPYTRILPARCGGVLYVVTCSTLDRGGRSMITKLKHGRIVQIIHVVQGLSELPHWLRW